MFADAAGALLTGTSSAITLIGTEFDGTKNGTSMNGLTWTTNGVTASSTTMTAVNDFQSTGTGALFTTTDTNSVFAVDNNLGHDSGLGTWNTSFSFTTSATDIIVLNDFILVSDNFSNGGDFNSTANTTLWTIELTGGTGAETITTEHVHTSDDGTAHPLSTTASFAGVTLDANTTYTVKITADGTNGAGFHIGLDSIAMGGTVSTVPEPSSALLLGLAGSACLILRRRV